MKNLVFLFSILSFFLQGQNEAELLREADEKYTAHEYNIAAGLYVQAFKKDSSNNTAAYNAACCFAMDDKHSDAIQWLGMAFGAGWSDINATFYDEDLAPLKNDTAWHCFIAPYLEQMQQAVPAIDKKLYWTFESARSFALCGNKNKAFENLGKAMDRGWTGINDDKATAAFASLKSDERWRELRFKFENQHVIGNRNFLSGTYLGVLFILFFYNLFLYVSIRDTSFLYYSLMIFAYSQLEAIRTPEFGYYARGIFPWYPYFDLIGKPFFFFISVSMLLHVLFVRTFLNTKTNNRKIHKWLTGFMIYLSIQGLLALFTGLNTRPFVYFSTLIIYVSTFIMGIISWRKGYRPARFFVIASISSTVGLTLQIIRVLGFVDLNIRLGVFGSDTLGIIVFFALLSFALGDKIKILTLEKETAQQKALAVLEEKVEERTTEVVEEKKKVEEQKRVIEEKQKEVLDSIHYARRIQSALITSERNIQKMIGRLKQ